MTAPAKRGTTARGTTVFLKFIMAVTGLVFIGYVLLHMYGNLKIFAGQEAFDAYAHGLRTFGDPLLPYGGLLWIVRIVLLVSIVGHLYAALTLWSRANGARSTRYAVKKAGAASLGSRTMRWGGVFILLFILWHLFHFTIGKPALNSSVSASEIAASPYAMVVASFQLWWMTLLYLAALVALGLHLSHGIFSVQQTLGWTQTARAYRRAKSIGHATMALIVVGFALPPLAILFRLIGN
ncbi:MAG TPA: succinate dehydrogenase cytochrome b subunit [Intrasporangiaceae bacterium]|nr:succinate dehydrogenase cytochrome b subunit [Intrasporangiaceae bacterium]